MGFSASYVHMMFSLTFPTVWL